MFQPINIVKMLINFFEDLYNHFEAIGSGVRAIYKSIKKKKILLQKLISIFFIQIRYDILESI